MKKQCGVYIIENKVDKKVYIGASKNIYDRLCQHKWHLRKNIHPNDHLQKAFNKYGESNFVFDLLEDCKEEYIFSQENYWCNLLNSHNRKYGYNVDPTNPIGKSKISDETKLKMSKSASKRFIECYTIYGDYYDSFSDLYKCADYFNTHASNIHRRMNVLFNKKNLIDSDITKYIIVDKNVEINHVKSYWNAIFEKIKSSKGLSYEVYDCFNNFLGNVDSNELSEILNVKKGSISNAIKNNRYLKTLKLKRCK